MINGVRLILYSLNWCL